MHFSTLTAALASAAAFTLTEAASKKSSRTFATVQFGGGKELTRCRLDPIVNPGGVSNHQHSVFGGNAFSADMPGDAATKATCTTANVKNDHSNYWVPSLYFKSPDDGTLYPVELFYPKVYYFFEPTNDEIKAFPKGFRMLAGDTSLRAPPSPAKDNLDPSKGPITPVQWTCPRSDSNSKSPLYPANSDGKHGVGIQDPSNGGQGWGFPDQECDGYASPLRADIHFPSCVNPNVDPANYKENSCYPSDNGQGGQDCPKGWIHVPHVFMEVYWNTLVFQDKWEKGKGNTPWVLSNGDTTGYSLHADFLNGWDTETLQYAIDNCDPGNDGLLKCPGLPGGATSEDEMKACKVTCPLGESDAIGTPMPGNKLLGNNPFSGYQAAPYAAPGGSDSDSSVAPQPVAPVKAAEADRPSTTMYALPASSKPEAQGANPQANPGGHTAYTSVYNIHTVIKTITVPAGGVTPAPVPAPPVAKGKKKEDCTTTTRRRHHRGRRHSHRALDY
ncbi:hypothetical protein Dda_5032 [Drechslerella dactyloides]|uniref:DUF1996 domain-containing protein n=1 Tax=Drechslerella dactyloides TaxID=74499 RepID=A0AAD6J2H7_DREDA|nr:hypothetical protein Dda_5032 [Drechslerella dactyloides]